MMVPSLLHWWVVLLQALANREVPIPEHIDMYLLDKEIAASDKPALQVGAAQRTVSQQQC